VIQKNEPGLVVEAYISDKSFEETLDFPSDGRYFTVKLKSTSDVTNVRDVPIQFAQVQLSNEAGETWDYSESAPGVYSLFNEEFGAEEEVQYRLTVTLPDTSVIESDWVHLPQSTEPMGEISFREEDIQKYTIQLRKEVIVTVKAIKTQILIPENSTGETIFYRWTFDPLWIYKPPFTGGTGYICWATDPYYIRHYALLQLNGIGNVKKDLFWIETIRNERIYEKFSALIVEQVMHEEYYHFWQEMHDRNQSGAILSRPPFNLQTNYHFVNGSGNVYGYFGIVREQARRWYFDKTELSYYVENTLHDDCTPPRTLGPQCSSCFAYTNGIVTDVKPSWWMK
jgi:hypothetical protein